MPPNPNTAVIAPHISNFGGVTLGTSFFKNERTRLDSYLGFPNAFMDVAKLAAAGFYYTKHRDVVRCAFCNIEVGSWEQGDDPLSEHKRWAAHCPFLNGQQVGNMPINQSNPPSPTETRGVDECGLYGITPVDPNVNVGPLERLGITRTVRALHPAFMSLQERLKSFEVWPMALQPRPEALATAGFFYTGQGDRCVCFQCGGGLKDWSDSDDPWVEHAKFFPLCTHVIHSKGQEFINNCRTAPAPNPSTESTSRQNTPLDTVVTPTDTVVTSTAAVVEPPVVESTSESTVTTSSPAEASCSRTEATTEPSASTAAAEKKEEGEKRVGTESCTKEETKEEEKSEALMCKICYQKEMCVAFLPCGHVVSCAKCAPSLQTCAVCRTKVSATVRVYLS